MNNRLHTITTTQLDCLNDSYKQEALIALESGNILYFPKHTFSVKEQERMLLSEGVLDVKHKNISYDYLNQTLAGFTKDKHAADVSLNLQVFLHRFALFSKELIDTILPQYKNAIQFGRTSYRPAEIKGRPTSKRKDDTRLHVDSFSATPVHGKRILRIFSNINPLGCPRVWQVGEPFSKVLSAFVAKIPPYNRRYSKLLHLIKATKSLRSAYDHYMLNLHDQMKLDENYQQTVTKQQVDFPADSTWLVFTDHVSHAALGGQFLLEQTFYLPVEAMANPELSPLKLWEKEKSTSLL